MKMKICLFKTLMFVFCILSYDKVIAQYAVSGNIFDPEHKPAEFALVQLIPNNLNTYSDSAGRYRFNNLPKGEYV
jgi:hypothetical protein